MMIEVEPSTEQPPIYMIARIAGHIYRDRKPVYKGTGNYHICIKVNHEDKYHLYSLESGLCVTSSEGYTLESSKYEDVTNLVSLKPGGSNDI